MAFNLDFELGKYENLKWEPITKQPFYAILYKNHPLANRSKLTRISLKDENFIFLKRNEAPYGFDRMISNFINCGFSPKIIHQTDSINTIYLMIKSEMGITIFPKYIDDKENNDLVFVELEGDNEYVESVLTWNSTNINPVLSLFLDYV